MTRILLCSIVVLSISSVAWPQGGGSGLRPPVPTTGECGMVPPPPDPEKEEKKGFLPFASPAPPVLPTTTPPRDSCHLGLDLTGWSDRGSWIFWWESHRRSLLEARRELAVTESVGFHTGLGLRPEDPSSHRLTAEEVRQDYLPALLQLLLEPQPVLASSAVLAIARIVPASESAAAHRGLLHTLSHPDHGTRQAAAFALGLLGDRSAVETLRHLLLDSRIGRNLTGRPEGVDAGVRVMAAAALGLLEDPAAVPDLEAVLLDRSLDAQWELQATAVTSLGLMRERHDEIVAFLLPRMEDRTLDARVRARIPGTLARLGAPGVREHLVARLHDPAVDPLMQRALVVSLGTLAEVADQDVFPALLERAHHSPDDQTRHFALLALGQIGARDDQPERRAESHGLLETALREAVLSPRRGSSRPYGALALAIYARDAGAESRERAADTLVAAFRETADPSARGALAVSLGILQWKDAATLLGEAFRKSRDPELRGYLALTLGMLGEAGYAPEFLALLARTDQDPELRLQLARSLGLLGNSDAAAQLEHGLARSGNAAEFLSFAHALGLIGNKEAAPLLRDVLRDPARPALERGFACTALGMLAEKRSLPGESLFEIHSEVPEQVPVLAEIKLLFAR